MALHILNFSIDAPDAQNNDAKENLSYNEIESIAEWVAEDILKIGNVFSETDDSDQVEYDFIKKGTVYEFCQIISNQGPQTDFYTIIYSGSNYTFQNTFCLGRPFHEIISPPPEA